MSLKSIFFVAVLAVSTACGEGVQPDQREMVYFTAVETDTLEPQPIPDPGIRLPKTQTAASEKIIDGFVENHERLLDDAEITKRIEQIENIFLALGRFHELMAIYRDDFVKRGTASHVADRYAWGLVRMGQRKQAREVINQLLVARPTEGRIHFLDGAAYLQEQPPNPADFPNIVRAWRRVLDFEPDYRGYEGINAQMLRAEIQKFESRIPASERPAPEPPPAAEPPPAETEPVEETPRPEPVEQPEPVEEPVQVEVDPAPEPPVEQPATPQPTTHSKDQRYRLEVAKGEIALGQGNYRAAEEAFLRAKALQPGGFDAEFGQLRAGWGTMAARNDVAAAARKLAERDDLEPEQRVELGIFLWSKLGRNDLAQKQWEAAKSADPALAPRIDSLLKQLK